MMTASEEVFTTTANKFATAMNVEYAAAAGFLTFLKVKGVAKQVGTEPNSRGRGKGSTIYQLPKTLQINLCI
jgi:hypothetical protein